MPFPTESDIKRLLDMKGFDRGFFSLAVYSFLEKYVRDYLNDVGYQFYNEQDENKFRKVLIAYWKKRFHGWYDSDLKEPTRAEREYNFLMNMMNGKEQADKVRHFFSKGELSQMETAVADLTSFFRLSDENDILSQLSPLKEMIKDWDNREASEEIQEELKNLRMKLLSYQKKHAQAVLTIEEIQKAKKDYEKLLEEEITLNNEQKAQIVELLEYVENFKQLSSYSKTRADYDSILMTPSTDQKKAIEQYSGTGDYIITGAAGTGKSYVLLKLLEKVVNEANSQNKTIKYKFLTYTNSLTKYNKYTLDILKNSSVDRDQVQTIDKFLSAANYTNSNTQTRPFNLWKERDDVKLYEKVPIARFYQKEFEKYLIEVIWSNNKITSKEDFKNYLAENKKTLRCPVDLFWENVENVHAYIEKCKDKPSEYITYKDDSNSAAAEYDYIFVDEAQDVPAARLNNIKQYCSNLIIGFDKDQSIHEYNNNWLETHTNVPIFNLKTNFRNTLQIKEFTEKYKKVALGIEESGISTSIGFRGGPDVDVIELNYDPDYIKFIKNKIDFYISELNYSPDDICIISPTTYYLETYEEFLDVLAQAGINAESLKSEEEFTKNGKVKFSTIQSVKGFNFPVVIFVPVGYRKDGGEIDNVIYPRENENSRKLVYQNYVAMSRAMNILIVLLPKQDARELHPRWWLRGIKEVFSATE